MSGEGIAWGRISSGLYAVGAGTFLLLNTQGILPWSFWLDALHYWPVALVALGIRLIFERSRLPWVVLLSPFLVLGTLTYVSLHGPSVGSPDWGPVRIKRPADLERWTLVGKLAQARFDLTARRLPDDLLVEGRRSPRDPRALEVTERRGSARVRIGRPSGSWRIHFLPIRIRRHSWELGLSKELPLALDLKTAFARGRAKLSEARVTRVDLDGAFNDLALELGEPESDTRLDLDGAFNHILLEVPPTTPVRVRTSGFLVFSDGRPDADSLSGPAYRVDLDGAFSRLVIRSP